MALYTPVLGLTRDFKASPEGLRLIVDKRGFTAGLVWRNVTVPHKEGEIR